MSFIHNLRGYSIVLSDEAVKDLKKIDKEQARIIQKKIQKLTDDSKGLDIKKLIARQPTTYRLRIGNYRVLYEIYEHTVVILVVHIQHRKDVYK